MLPKAPLPSCAIAISKTSQKIDGPYQDVLTRARELGDATTFIKRINRPGSANDSMRRFVNTFKSHLREYDAAHDDESVWRLLRRLQILVFDFTARGRCRRSWQKNAAFAPFTQTKHHVAVNCGKC
jgi:hypothetical protein